MKIIKYLFTFMMVFACLGLCACGSKTTTTETTTTENTTTETTTTENTTTENNVFPTSVDVSKVNFVNPGKLTVVVSTDFAPMEFVDLTKTGQDKYVGADIEFAKVLAQAFGVELYIKSMDFDSLLTALDNNVADIAISGFSYTEDRAASYLFTNCYYQEGDGGQVVVVNKANLDQYQTLDSINVSGKKIAAQNGSLQVGLVENQLANATLVLIDDLNAAYDMLSSGSIDGVAVATSVATTLVEKFPDKYAICPQAFDYVEDGNFALVKKNNTALKDAVDAVIAQFEKDTFQKWVDEAKILFTQLGDNAGEDIYPEEE